jgi:hypothetical protein
MLIATSIRDGEKGRCLQGVESDGGADGDDVDDQADGRCDQDGVDRNA